MFLCLFIICFRLIVALMVHEVQKILSKASLHESFNYFQFRSQWDLLSKTMHRLSSVKGLTGTLRFCSSGLECNMKRCGAYTSFLCTASPAKLLLTTKLYFKAKSLLLREKIFLAGSGGEGVCSIGQTCFDMQFIACWDISCCLW